MLSVNQYFLDESISHQVDLRRYEAGLIQRMVATLNRSDSRLFAELTNALQRLDPGSFTMKRLEAMLANVRGINTQAYAALTATLETELKAFVAYELAYQSALFAPFVAVQVSFAAITAEQVYAAAMARPFQGGLLKGFLSEIEASKAKRIRQAVAQGFVESKTTDQIVRELRGTRAKGYADGLLEITRRDAQAVVRTALSHMAGFVQDRVTESNKGIIKAVIWHSTLDTRTSAPCIARDLKQYTPDTHKPMGHSLPWGAGPGRFHWWCRSAQAYVLKSNKELGIDAPDVVMTDGTRASMDGQVPKETSYADWISKQSAARQDQVLGVTRGKMLRNGDLTVAKMFDAKGKLFTLEELAKQ